jgi:sugar (pentulose or hexulose) kinase
MFFLALDLGTTFIKGGILDLDRLRITHIRRLPFPDPVAGLPALFYEVDPQTIVNTTRQLIQALLADAPDCAGIVLCTQMHGMVLCSETGQPLSNVITWQDQRVLSPHPAGQGSYFDHLRARLSEQERQHLGNEVQPSRPLCYLHWMVQNGQLPPGPAVPAGIPDFVIANLCATMPSMEATSAAAHCAFNLTQLEWHWAVLEKLGLAHLRWPTVRRFGEVVGVLEIDGKRIPFYTPIGDHQCALVGAFLGNDELSLNISTGSQATILTPALVLGNYQTRPFFDGRFMNTITGVPAGRSLNHLVNLLTELAHGQGIELPDPWRYITEAAANVKATDLTVNLAFYDSFAGKEGQISHLREENISVGHLFYAAFQNMADNYYASALRLSPNQSWRRLVFSGGLAQKIDLLRELIQRKFQVDYRVCASSEDTLLGLLALALVASGRLPSVTQATEMLLANYSEE